MHKPLDRPTTRLAIEPTAPASAPPVSTFATAPSRVKISSSDQPARPRASSRLARGAWRLAERGFAIFGLLVALWWLTLDVSIITSPSMTPALQGTSLDNGDHVLTEKISYWFRKPRRWEVITFFTPEGDKRMKRVAGLPGEHVQMTRQGKLVIDGRQVDVPKSVDVKYLSYGNLTEGKPVPCGDGYYVLGDDLKDSDDSRFNGPLAADAIIGRAWLILWPKASFGWVK